MSWLKWGLAALVGVVAVRWFTSDDGKEPSQVAALPKGVYTNVKVGDVIDVVTFPSSADIGNKDDVEKYGSTVAVRIVDKDPNPKGSVYLYRTARAVVTEVKYKRPASSVSEGDAVLIMSIVLDALH